MYAYIYIYIYIYRERDIYIYIYIAVRRSGGRQNEQLASDYSKLAKATLASEGYQKKPGG